MEGKKNVLIAQKVGLDFKSMDVKCIRDLTPEEVELAKKHEAIFSKAGHDFDCSTSSKRILRNGRASFILLRQALNLTSQIWPSLIV